MLREAGYRQRTDPKQLVASPTPPTSSSSSTCARATSRCTSARAPSTSASPAVTCCSTAAPRPRSRCSSASAAPPSASRPRPATSTDVEDLAGKRIATSYDGVVRALPRSEHGIDATVIRLDGAVETSVQLGVADVIADVVETGSTLRAAGLEIFGDVIMESEAVLVSRVGAAEHPGLEVFLRRLQGVLVARSYVMMDYDIPEARVEQAVGADARHREPDGLARCTARAGSPCARWCRATRPSR